MAVPGIDLSGASGLAAALSRATRLNGVVATPIASPRTGNRGLFLVAPAPNRIGKALRAGYVAVFVSARALHEAATGEPAVPIRASGGSAQARDRGETSIKVVHGSRPAIHRRRAAGTGPGAAAVLPWFILAGGLLVVALGGALALNATRRARAQEELNRIFTMSQDLDRGCDFDGRFTRKPAAGEILGYTEEEPSRARISTSSIRPTGTARRRRRTPSLGASRRCRSRTVTSARTARSGCSTGRRRRCREPAHVRRRSRRDRAPQCRGRSKAPRRRTGGAAAVATLVAEGARQPLYSTPWLQRSRASSVPTGPRCAVTSPTRRSPLSPTGD